MDEGAVGHELIELKRMLRALGDVVRLEMITVLARQHEINVTDLGQMLMVNGRHISQPLVSWHLTMLRRVGLVRTRRDGRLVYCSLDTERYEYCLHALKQLVGHADTPGTAVSAAAGLQPETPAHTVTLTQGAKPF